LSKNKGAVYVQGDFANASTKSMFVKAGYVISPSIDASDIVVWTGGEDIDPRIYGEENKYCWGVSPERDNQDLAAVDKAWGLNKFLVGVCRGAQLLNCFPNAGKLWQDVDGHGGGVHVVRDFVTDALWACNTLHHQMLRPTKDALIVAGVKRSCRRKNADGVEEGDQVDPEVVYYHKTKSLLFQGHPEFGHLATTNYFFELMDRYWLGTVTKGRRHAITSVSTSVNTSVSVRQPCPTYAVCSSTGVATEAAEECANLPGSPA